MNPEALRGLPAGKFLPPQGDPGHRRRASISSRRAIKLDASQPEAHAGLAEALCYAGIFGLRPSAETYPQARRRPRKPWNSTNGTRRPTTLWRTSRKDMTGIWREPKRSFNAHFS